MKTIEINDRVKIRIEHDEDAESPGQWSNLGEITYKGHGRYCLGTEGVSDERFGEISRKVRDGEYIGMPVYAYVHGSATIKAAWSNPFGCPWDSGRSGWVYTTREKALKEFGGKRVTKALREKVYNVLRSEVETFDMYLQGDVYGWIVEVDGEEVDSCWGCWGFDYAESEARAAAAQYVEQEATCTTL
jgi:hypothetical protein